MNVKLKRLLLLRRVMLWLNAWIVLFDSSLFYSASNLIVLQKNSYQFLLQLNRLPLAPARIFWSANLLMLALILLMTYRHHASHSTGMAVYFFTGETILAALIYLSLQMTYNGIFLLILIDYFLYSRNMNHIHHLPFWAAIAAVFLLLYSISSFSIMGDYFKMPSLATYIRFLPFKFRSFLTLIQNFQVTLNLLLFISIIVFYGMYLLAEERDIQEALEKADRANKELQNYAALSEKIAQNRERKRIARDIHDTVGHTLTGIAAGVDAAKVLIDINPQAAKTQLDKISQAVKSGIKGVRKTLNQMRPGALSNYTLETSLRKMLEEYSDISRLKIQFNYQWQNPDFEKTTENVIFRIIEESITNSLRHGHASEVMIDCLETSNVYLLQIQDNGTGAKNFKPGFGITQMRERVAIINGQMTIDSENGFNIVVEIPKEKEKLN